MPSSTTLHWGPDLFSSGTTAKRSTKLTCAWRVALRPPRRLQRAAHFRSRSPCRHLDPPMRRRQMHRRVCLSAASRALSNHRGSPPGAPSRCAECDVPLDAKQQQAVTVPNYCVSNPTRTTVMTI